MNDKLDSNLQIALGEILDRVALISEQFFPDDVPDNRRIGFRNKFVKFPCAYIHDILNPNESDDWSRINLPLLAKLSPSQHVRIIGILHFYVVTRAFCRRNIAVPEYRELLNWIFNSYDFPGSAAMEWHELSRRSSEPENLAEAKRKMYSEIAAITGGDPKDEENAGGWSGVAIIASDYRFNELEHDNWCAQTFGQ